MKFIQHHWFGIITGLFVFLCFSLFILVLISPRQDLQKRGFIPCTEIMAENIISCEENKFTCVLSAVLKNSWCDIKVIGQGISDWAKRKQPYPWSNYIFIPEIPVDDDFDDEAREEYLKNNPDFKLEMEQLKKLNKELENEEELQMQLKPEDKPKAENISQ